jgi:hypothetical protein
VRRILKYISSLLLLTLLSSVLQAQKPGMRLRGPRVGVDLAGLVLLYTEPERSIYTFSVDYEAWQDIYPVLEFGFQNVKLKRETYNYISSGIFGRFGVDLNLLKYEQTNVYEMFFTGFRYGISYLTHQADDIYLADPYFGDVTGEAVNENQLNVHWISLVGGVKVEVFDNFFMGWSVFANIKLMQIEDENMTPYNIPGFGPGDKRTSVLFNYTLSYRFLPREYKPKKIIKKKPIPEQVDIPTQN